MKIGILHWAFLFCSLFYVTRIMIYTWIYFFYTNLKGCKCIYVYRRVFSFLTVPCKHSHIYFQALAHSIFLSHIYTTQNMGIHLDVHIGILVQRGRKDTEGGLWTWEDPRGSREWCGLVGSWYSGNGAKELFGKAYVIVELRYNI